MAFIYSKIFALNSNGCCWVWGWPFNFGGTASNIAGESSIKAKYDGKIEVEELRTITTTDENGEEVFVSMINATDSLMNLVNSNTEVVEIMNVVEKIYTCGNILNFFSETEVNERTGEIDENK